MHLYGFITLQHPHNHQQTAITAGVLAAINIIAVAKSLAVFKWRIFI